MNNISAGQIYKSKKNSTIIEVTYVSKYIGVSNKTVFINSTNKAGKVSRYQISEVNVRMNYELVAA